MILSYSKGFINLREHRNLVQDCQLWHQQIKKGCIILKAVIYPMFRMYLIGYI